MPADGAVADIAQRTELMSKLTTLGFWL
jgi:hypothetical protein